MDSRNNNLILLIIVNHPQWMALPVNHRATLPHPNGLTKP